MVLEHLEQVAHLLAFGANWRPWEWHTPATYINYKVSPDPGPHFIIYAPGPKRPTIRPQGPFSKLLRNS